MEDPYADLMDKRNWIPQMHRRSAPNQIFTENYNTPYNFRQGKETKDALGFLPTIGRDYDDNEEEELRRREEDDEEQRRQEEENIRMYSFRPEIEDPDMLALREIMDSFQAQNEVRRMRPITPGDFETLMDDFAAYEPRTEIKIDPILRVPLRTNELPNAGRFLGPYSSTDNFEEGWEQRDNNLPEYEEIPESRVYIDEIEEEQPEYGSGFNKQEEFFREFNNKPKPSVGEKKEIFRELANINDYLKENKYEFDIPQPLPQLTKPRDEDRQRTLFPKIYTEGGVVYAKDKEKGKELIINRVSLLLKI